MVNLLNGNPFSYKKDETHNQACAISDRCFPV